MKDNFKTIFLFAALLVFTGSVFAQKVAFEVKAPQVVAVGEVFRVEFTADANPKKFHGPEFGGIDVLAGPSMSVNKSRVIINGNLEQENRYTYTYVLQCNSEGEFTIGAATIDVGRDNYSTKPHVIKAIEESDAASSAQSGAGATGGNAGAASGNNDKTVIAPDDVLLMATVDKRTVFKGEPVKVTFKLYTRQNINLGGYQGSKIPAFNGFWTQQLDTNNNSGPQRETYDNKIYNTWVMAEYLLFPQMAGSLTIDPMEITAIIHMITQQRRQSIFDDFFGGPDIQEIRRKVASKPITIKVNELPAGAPASFSGAVGEFQMTPVLPASEVVANTAVTYNIRISGNGNLSQIQAPKLNIPASFEQYTVKTTEALNNTAYGVSGYRQFEYPVIARVVGEYDIKPVEFSYFNPKLAKYETLTTPSLALTVLPDSTSVRSTAGVISGYSKEDIKIFGRDIRFIKLGAPNLHPQGRIFIWSPSYFLVLILLIGLFVFLLVWLRKYMEERRNSALIKGKRANKVALLRFRAAESYMKQESQRGFYEEMLKGLWGYMSDKLNIPVANLTKENVREELIKKGVDQELAERYVEVIGECEYAQYAPSASGRMSETYTAGVELISKLESLIGR